MDFKTTNISARLDDRTVAKLDAIVKHLSTEGHAAATYSRTSVIAWAINLTHAWFIEGERPDLRNEVRDVDETPT